MILPTKGIPPEAALLTTATRILPLLREPKTVSRLWDDVRKTRQGFVSSLTFDSFVLALDLLFLTGVVEMERGRIVKLNVEADEARVR